MSGVGVSDSVAVASDHLAERLTSGPAAWTRGYRRRAAAADAPQTTSTSAKGAVCVAPLPSWPPETSAPDVPQCGSGNFSIKIDDRAPVDWPRKESAKLDPLDVSPRHRVIILCDKRPNQSFTFRFSAYDEPNLCLFMNDFYSTFQLWERKRAPWCKCDAAAPRK